MYEDKDCSPLSKSVEGCSNAHCRTSPPQYHPNSYAFRVYLSKVAISLCVRRGRVLDNAHTALKPRPRQVQVKPREVGNMSRKLGSKPKEVGNNPRELGDKPRGIKEACSEVDQKRPIPRSISVKN